MTPPTDLELMMYFDGELEEPRSSEVRAFLAPSEMGSSSGAHGKLGGLSLIATLVRENAHASAAQADSIAGDVMKQIDAEQPRALKIGLAKPKPEPIGSRVKVPVLVSRALRAPAAAANDNGRLIFGLSALAAAAAAVLFLWGKNPPAEAPTAATGAGRAEAVATDMPVEPTPATSIAAHSADSSGSPATDAPDEGALGEGPSAEVASVDFGSRAGALYYVSGDNTGADGRSTTTTVVWLTDE